MTWTVAKVRKVLGGKLVGSGFMRTMVCKTLLKLTPELTEQVCRTVWFISSPEDSWGFTFRGADIKDRHLVFLSEELFQQNEAQIYFTILHEVGHVILNHRNSIGYEQSKAEITRQEDEADSFAKRFLSA